MKPSERNNSLLKLLKKNYPEAQCALHHKNPFQLLIATILSAQCTDERVNLVTPKLFKFYPTEKEMAKADLSHLEELIYSTGFYKHKAKNILETAKKINSDFRGGLPQDIEALQSLPGVGRKTANVVLGNAFQVSSGVVVDTHVARLSQRMGLTRAKAPLHIEKDLMKIVPKNDWIAFSHWLILHGRQVCSARKPHCDTCFLVELCPKKGLK